jgi:glutathionylspermidine synthase
MERRTNFTDLDERPILNLFKLYPWEWLMHEEFGKHLLEVSDKMFWIEPAWKMILSNKAILPILWELNPNHKNLLPTYFEYNKEFGDNYVKKPLLSREGADIVLNNGTVAEMGQPQGYGDEGFIYQKLALLPNFDNNFPVIGSWIVGGEAAGIGIREDAWLITSNMSRFIPHFIKD